LFYKLKNLFVCHVIEDPKLRITRRLGVLPGLTTKKSHKTNRPGKDGNAGGDNKKLTVCVQLKKIKLKFNYGLTESQLFRYVKARRRRGVTGLIFINSSRHSLLYIRFCKSYCASASVSKTMDTLLLIIKQ
jgi:hypothetical protein